MVSLRFVLFCVDCGWSLLVALRFVWFCVALGWSLACLAALCAFGVTSAGWSQF